MRKFALSLAILAALGVAAAAATADVRPPPPAAPVAAAPSAAAVKTVAAAVTSYNAVRKALAADDLAAAKRAAPDVAGKATGAATAYPAARSQFADMANAALAVSNAADIKAARVAFGNVSKSFITAVAMDKTFQTGLVCYRCPMAKTYQKWLQPGDEMGNPYWGAEMLKCGGKVPVVP